MEGEVGTGHVFGDVHETCCGSGGLLLLGCSDLHDHAALNVDSSKMVGPGGPPSGRDRNEGGGLKSHPIVEVWGADVHQCLCVFGVGGSPHNDPSWLASLAETG